MSIHSLLVKFKRFINGEVSTSKLISRGMTVGERFHRGSGCFIDPSHCFLITIGDNVTMSINVTVLAHDASTEKLIGYTKIGQVHIGNNVFIGAGAIVLPGVTIGDNSIVAAGSIVTRSIEPGQVWGGNPAAFICSVEDYKAKHLSNSIKSSRFGEEYTMRHHITEDQIDEMKKTTEDHIAYIK